LEGFNSFNSSSAQPEYADGGAEVGQDDGSGVLALILTGLKGPWLLRITTVSDRIRTLHII
jgi:hypothetical protein